MYDKTSIYMISYKTCQYHVWYHVWNYTQNYNIAYDIIYEGDLSLSCATSYCQTLWYHIWYHSLCYDIVYDITKTMIQPFLRYFHRALPMIAYTYPRILPNMSELRDIIPVFSFHICLWYPVLRDIIAIRYHRLFYSAIFMVVSARRGLVAPGARWFLRVLQNPSSYFDGLITCPTFLVQSVQVTFLGKKRLHDLFNFTSTLVYTVLHPFAPRWMSVKINEIM
jgi:hypothetical protein